MKILFLVSTLLLSTTIFARGFGGFSSSRSSGFSSSRSSFSSSSSRSIFSSSKPSSSGSLFKASTSNTSIIKPSSTFKPVSNGFVSVPYSKTYVAPKTITTSPITKTTVLNPTSKVVIVSEVRNPRTYREVHVVHHYDNYYPTLTEMMFPETLVFSPHKWYWYPLLRGSRKPATNYNCTCNEKGELINCSEESKKQIECKQYRRADSKSIEWK